MSCIVEYHRAIRLEDKKHVLTMPQCVVEGIVIVHPRQ